MRTALNISAVAVLAVTGCYRSHARPEPVDAPPPRDAPPTCVARCEPPVVIARVLGDGSLGRASIAVRDGAVFMTSQAQRDSEYFTTLIRFDPHGAGVLSRVDIPREPPPEARYLVKSFLTGSAGTPELWWLATEISFRRGPWRAFVRRQSLSEAGTPLGEPAELGMVEGYFEPVDRGGVAIPVVGRAAAEGIVWRYGTDVFWADIDGTVIREPRVFARVEGAPPGYADVDAVVLADGRGAVTSHDAREGGDAVLAFEQRSGAVTIEVLPGERFDPSASIVASGEGLGLVRVVSNPRDVADTRLMAQVRDGDGEVIDRLEVRPAFGLTPPAATVFDHEGAPAFAWVEADGTLRVVPSSGHGDVARWSECEGVTTTPIRELDLATVPLVAADAGDGSGDVFLLVWTSDPSGLGAFELLRVPGCRLDAAF